MNHPRSHTHEQITEYIVWLQYSPLQKRLRKRKSERKCPSSPLLPRLEPKLSQQDDVSVLLYNLVFPRQLNLADFPGSDLPHWREKKKKKLVFKAVTGFQTW